MEAKALVFRVNDGQGPELLMQVFLERGWLEFDERSQDVADWNIWWRSSRFRHCDYEQLMPWQRLNHYPKSTGITRKDCLARHLKRMKGVYGAGVFNFSPIVFNLPNDYTRYVAEYTKLKQSTDGKGLWICKPADMSRGRGIFIFRDLSDLQYDCSAVVQRYIMNPLLIAGYKCDIRVYVAVPCFHPLSVYIYQEGLVRFGTEKFDLTNIQNVFAHLTNTSINKYSPSYSTDKERVGPGCKWTLNQLRHYFHQNNVDDSRLWRRVVNIVVLTLITQAPMVSKVDNCFELYGFDILVDDNLKPWLLEVNFSPSLSADCQADNMVKKPMLHDLMEMMNFKTNDVDRGGEAFHRHGLDKSHAGYGSERNMSVSRLSRVRYVPNPNLFTKEDPVGTSFMKMAGDDVEQKPIFGLPLSNQTDEGCPSEPESEPEVLESPKSISKAKSDTSFSKTSAGSMSQKMSDTPKKMENSIRESRSARSDKTSARKHSFKLHKVHSKGSSISDSGISTFSGSSENSDLTSKHDWNSRRSSGKPAIVVPILIPSGNPKIESKEVDSPQTKGQISQKRPVKKYGYTSSFRKNIKSPFKSVSQLATVTRVGHNAFIGAANNFEVNNPSEAADTVPATSPGSPTPTKFTVRRRRSHVTMSDSSQMKKAAARVHVRSLNSGPSSHPQRQNLVGKFPVVRPAKNSFNFSKPVVPKGPKEVIGEFFLVFPFNDVTRKAAATSLDARVIIRETQKLLKEASVKAGTGTGTGSGTVAGAGGNVPRLWGPLRSPES